MILAPSLPRRRAIARPILQKVEKSNLKKLINQPSRRRRDDCDFTRMNHRERIGRPLNKIEHQKTKMCESIKPPLFREFKQNRRKSGHRFYSQNPNRIRQNCTVHHAQGRLSFLYSQSYHNSQMPKTAFSNKHTNFQTRAKTFYIHPDQVQS